jgi:hypothetical protein
MACRSRSVASLLAVAWSTLWVFPSACDRSIVLGDGRRSAVSSDLPDSAGPPGIVDTAPRAPARGQIVWSTDHETGDLADWERGGESQGGQYYWSSGAGRVIAGAGRGGSRALEMVIDTAGDAPSHGARVYRRIEPAPAFYSAWFLLEEAHAVSDWWAIFLFHARDDSLSLDNYRSLWDVRVSSNAEGRMALQFFDHDTGRAMTADASAVVPAGRWFQIEAFLDYRPPDATTIQIRLDGVFVLEMTGLRTATEKNVFWVVGNGGSGLAPSRSTVLIDDAAITAARPGT